MSLLPHLAGPDIDPSQITASPAGGNHLDWYLTGRLLSDDRQAYFP